ncbi:hypothetical protein Q5692_16110 [Microcoleus sp. C2C3]|uniref:hypothetical protein n=1 Tax=unclassified Microcoleus TaxID=2642155 RepID=UPI002FD41C6F
MFEDCHQLSTVNRQLRDLRIKTHILHHSQEQARCLFHKKIHSLWNRHLACS